MPINVKCPRCAYKGPVTSFVDRSTDGKFMQLGFQIPAQIQPHFIQYLSLFRPASGSAMASTKAERIITDFIALVSKGYVSAQGKVDRPCPPYIWATAMEQMLEKANTLTLPMKSHGYLRTIAYPLADQADSQVEKKQHASVQRGEHRTRQPADTGMSEIMLKFERKFGEQDA